MPTTAGHILSTFLFFLLFVPVLFWEAEGERPSTEDESCGHHQCHVYCGTDCAEGPIPAPAPRGREAMTLLPHMLSPVWERPVESCLGGTDLWKHLS